VQPDREYVEQQQGEGGKFFSTVPLVGRVAAKR
jgi:hypothetical protein